MSTDTLTATEVNKALVRRFVEEVFEKGNLAAIDEFVAMPSIAAVLRNDVPAIHATLTEVRCPMGAMVAEGDLVAAEFTLTGVHSGDAMGTEPTGNPVVVANLCILRIVDGKIGGASVLADRLGLFQQLGVEQVPPLAPCPIA
jgi:predicted ester cyclase